MIVVVIIGILGSIALPVYHDYTTRTKWSGMVAEIRLVKRALTLCFHHHSNNATDCDTATKLNKYGVTGSALPTPKYGSILVLSGAAAGGVITMGFTGTTSVGGYEYEMESAVDATGTKIVWAETANDDIPDKIMKNR